MAEEYRVSSMPTFAFVMNHQTVDRVVSADILKLTSKIVQYAGADGGSSGDYMVKGQVSNLSSLYTTVI